MGSWVWVCHSNVWQFSCIIFGHRSITISIIVVRSILGHGWSLNPCHKSTKNNTMAMLFKSPTTYLSSFFLWGGRGWGGLLTTWFNLKNIDLSTIHLRNVYMGTTCGHNLRRTKLKTVIDFTIKIDSFRGTYQAW